MANTCRQLKMNKSTSRPVMSSGCSEPKLHNNSESFDSAQILSIFGFLFPTKNIQDHLQLFDLQLNLRYKTHKILFPQMRSLDFISLDCVRCFCGARNAFLVTDHTHF